MLGRQYRNRVMMVLLLLAGSGHIGPLLALGVGPARIALSLDPGRSIEGTLYVDSKKTATSARVTVGDWSYDEKGNLRYLDKRPERSLSGWISVWPVSFNLAPGKVQVVRYRLTVPGDITGGYWGIVFVESTQPAVAGKENQVGVQMRTRLGVTVYGETPRGAVRDGRVVKVEGSWSTETGLRAKAIFENKGNVMVRLKGRFEIREKNGKTVGSMPFGYDRDNEIRVLPESRRQVECCWSDPLTRGNYILVALVDYGASNIVAGQCSFGVK